MTVAAVPMIHRMGHPEAEKQRMLRPSARSGRPCCPNLVGWNSHADVGLGPRPAGQGQQAEGHLGTAKDYGRPSMADRCNARATCARGGPTGLGVPRWPGRRRAGPRPARTRRPAGESRAWMVTDPTDTEAHVRFTRSHPGRVAEWQMLHDGRTGPQKTHSRDTRPHGPRPFSCLSARDALRTAQLCSRVAVFPQPAETKARRRGRGSEKGAQAGQGAAGSGLLARQPQ